MKKFSIRLFCLIAAIAMLIPLAAAFVSCEKDTPEDTTEPVTDTTSAEPEGTEAVLDDILAADLSKYSLIRPEKASDTLLEESNALFRTLKEKFSIADYKDDFHRDDVPMYQIGEFEIIIGNADRPESREFLANLKYNDYGYAQIGKKIVIAGHTDEATVNAINKFMSAVVQKTNGAEGVFYTKEYDFIKNMNYDVSSIYIGGTSISDYRIVYPKKNDNSEKTAANMIAEAIAEISGIVVSVIHDGEAEANGCEILIGATNRTAESDITAISSKLGAMESIIKNDGKNIMIFGNTSTGLFVAANEFVAKFEVAPTEKLELSLAAEEICKYNDSILTAMSFNVWVSGKTSERNERVLSMVRKYFPDTVGFQEVDYTWLSTLNAGLKDQYAWVGEGRNGGTGGEYNPIFYKKDIFNLIDSGTKWLSDTPDRVSKVEESSLNRIYTYALLERKSDGTRIMVVNTHFDHTSAEAREKQAAVLVKYLKTITDYPIILTGDFNCVSSSSAYSKVISGGVVDANDVAEKRINNAATFTNYGSSNKIIDFVFVSPDGIAVTSYQVCNEMINGDFPSDHHPVLIEYAVLG